jgi:hypothetical protein
MILTDFPAFSTICINALEQFEAVGSCKGLVFNSLDCYQSPWTADTRDEQVHEDDPPNCRAFDDEFSRHDDAAETISLSSYLHPMVPSKMHNHKRTDSTTTVQSLDEEIFRNRRLSIASDSVFFPFCKLHRCSAFSQDSADHFPNRSNGPSRCDTPVEVVYWEDLVKGPEVKGII